MPKPSYSYSFALIELQFQWRKKPNKQTLQLRWISWFFFITLNFHSFGNNAFSPISKKFEVIFLSKFIPAPELLKLCTLTFHRTYFHELCLWSLQSLVKQQCERKTMIGCLLHRPHRGLNLQPRYVPWRIEPATFQFTGRCSN